MMYDLQQQKYCGGMFHKTAESPNPSANNFDFFLRKMRRKNKTCQIKLIK